jgi:methionine aminotransferase
VRFTSKLPEVGTTIFTVMSRRATEENALNIGQGFPDYAIDPRLSASLIEVIGEGRNQYAPMEGTMDLREQIARKLESCYQRHFDPQTEITVTCGGTEALYDAIQSVVGPGDEAIIFDPAYDSYEPAVRLAGGRCVRIALSPPAFRFDWDEVRRALSDRTRLIIINSPQNPSCTVATREDLDALAACIRDRPITVIADEVYEHVLFDGRRHQSVLTHPELRERSYAVFSFGKTLHATGWRIGYCVAPPELTRELRKVHQFNTSALSRRCSTPLPAICPPTPMRGRASRHFSRPSAIYWQTSCALPDSSRCRPRARIFNWWITGQSVKKMTCSSPIG